MNNTPPLTGITVLAFEHAIAAPLCTRQLAELGARVIKIERRDTGDFARHYDNRTKGQSSHFVWTNRSKLSLSLDIKHQQARPVLQRLISASDVIVQNLAPGAALRLGLDFDTLSVHDDQLIICNISGYGNNGPYGTKKAYDLLIQAEAGLLSITGTPEHMAKCGISIADVAAGMQAHAAILAALIQRGKTGLGSRIDISLFESMVEWMGYPLNYAYDGANPPSRSGADHASIYPYGVFTCRDGEHFMLGLQNDREWRVFCENVLNQNSLATDSRFISNDARSKNRAQLREIIQDKITDLSLEEVTHQLDKAQIAFARINDMHDLWQHPQLEALDRFIETATPNGPVTTLKPPANSSAFPPALGAVPDIGEHNSEILTDLGFSVDEIAAFTQAGVI